MDAFLIPCASGTGSLEFFERTPVDPRLPLERFKVRLTGPDLSAVARVYVSYVSEAAPSPASLLAQMSESWRGWQGEFAWDSFEGDLALRCTQDRTGHVAIEVNLRPGPTEADWSVRATVMTEAGQLEELARLAAGFFGQAD